MTLENSWMHNVHAFTSSTMDSNLVRIIRNLTIHWPRNMAREKILEHAQMDWLVLELVGCKSEMRVMKRKIIESVQTK